MKIEGAATGTSNVVVAAMRPDEGTEICRDKIKVKGVPLNITAVSPSPSSDEHEVCHRDKLIIQCNNNDSDLDEKADNDSSDTLIVGGDPDMAKIRISPPTGAVAADISGNITITFPSNIAAWKANDKSGGAAPTTYSLTDLTSGIYIWLEGLTPSSAILDTEIKVEMTLNSGVKCRDSIKYTVIDVDMDMDGVVDAEEEAVGRFIALNDDDNNFNGIEDKSDPGAVTDEDDLVKITLNKVKPVVLTGSVVLNAGTGLSIWTSSTRGSTPLTLPASYSTPSSLPKELYVEGTAVSSSILGTYVKLEYTIGGKTFTDKIRVTVIDVDITEPDGSLDWGENPSGRNPGSSWESTSERFDFQGVVAGEPGDYDLTIAGAITSLTGITYQWDLASSCGSLSNETTASPTHTSPTSSDEGMLQLEAYYNGNATGIIEKRKLKIYEDHLARDYENFGAGGPCLSGWNVTAFNINPQPTMTDWNCHGSVIHAYNGSGTGYSNTTLSIGTTTVYINPTASDWTSIESSLSRGDVVSFWSSLTQLQHSHTCRGSSSQMYGANNEPSVNFSNIPPATWKWGECSSKAYYDAVNAASQSYNGTDFLTIVKVHSP